MASGQDLTFGQKLRRERASRHWSQARLSQEIVGDKSLVLSIYRWENDIVIPHLENQAKLCKAFGKPVELWGVKEPKSKIWNVPYLSNPYFTGRDQLLQRLHKALTSETVMTANQIRAISGLGGIGKTQTAIEYAYRYKDEYDAVLWIRADTAETIASDFAQLASSLELPEKDEVDQSRKIAAVRLWLQKHGPWLLIFDNADDTAVLDFLPRQPSGAILVTTRSQEPGLHIKALEMKKMSQEEGVTFLLRRSRSEVSEDDEEAEDPVKNTSTSELEAAKELWKAMDGLPLALDQAGAYIKAGQTTISNYNALFQKEREGLLQVRGGTIPEHPAAVATTWSLSFERVAQRNPFAAELLRFCAFLSPDAIPEELILRGMTHLPSARHETISPASLLDNAISTLRTYSLIHRDAATRTFSIHRLVQAVLIDAMSEVARSQWKERIVFTLNDIFPEAPYKDWTKCRELLPHVLLCATWLEQGPLAIWEAASLFDKVGSFLREQGQYVEAESLLLLALSLREKYLGTEDLDTARILSNLAGLYDYQGKVPQEETLVKRVLAIREQLLGTDHPDTAKTLNHLAILSMRQENYEQAEAYFQRALTIYERHAGNENSDADMAKALNNLAVLFVEIKRYEQAELSYERALAINTHYLGTEHPQVARNKGNLALLYVQQGKYEEAETFYQEAISIHERTSGLESPETAYPLYGLAELYRLQRKFAQAEPLYLRTLLIREKYLDAEHLDTAESLQGLADLYQDQGRFQEAEPYYVRTLAIREKVLGREHPLNQTIQQRYANLQETMRGDAEAHSPEEGISKGETISSENSTFNED